MNLCYTVGDDAFVAGVVGLFFLEEELNFQRNHNLIFKVY